MSPAAALAADSGFANNNGASVFFSDEPSLLRKFPTLESVVPVPSIADVSGRTVIPISCRVRAEDSGGPVKGARGTYRAELLVLDRGTGMSEIFPLKSGTFRTKTNGVSRFKIEIPTAIFAGGFESGGVSAWSYARTAFKKKTKGTFGALDCDVTVMKN
ncbi:MAG: hypothetical protein GY769_02790 [bacterium]|nr:hypothetical protein [bacterium]